MTTDPLQTQVITLSPEARFKGRLCYYALVLHLLNLAFLSWTESDPKAKALYASVSIFLALGCYQMRPSHIQTVIDRFVQQGRFPVRIGSPILIRNLMVLGFVLSLVKYFTQPEQLTAMRIGLDVLALPGLFFMFDSELTQFIWRKSKA